MSITFEKVTYQYNANSPLAYTALLDVDLQLAEHKITAIIGETGSGKSTLVQHLNALLIPTSGSVHVLDYQISADKKNKELKNLRRKVGLVFQFPEYQLFEETIIKDVSFGLKNFGIREEEATIKAREVLELVGIDETYFEKSPFELSGGQKRRVAIAGILAMDPEVLVLDEPTAGLDPQGAQEMMDLFVRLNKSYHKTIFIVTHNMEHVLTYCDHVVFMHQAKVKMNTDTHSFFENKEILQEFHLQPPMVIRLRDELIQRGFAIPTHILDIDELITIIASEVTS